jgi:predicted RNA-binding protein with PUA-like domain
LQSPWHRGYKFCIAVTDPKELWKFVKKPIQIVRNLSVLANLDTARDPSHPYYDEKSANKEEPTWYMVDVKFIRKLKRLVPLKELQEYKEAELKDMVVVGKGRLSVQPVRQKEWDFILTLEDKIPDEE